MLKTSWIYLVLVVVMAGGAATYYYLHQTATVDPLAASAPPAPTVISPQPSPNDDEVKRKTIEGIGSIKKLKPVPLQSTPQH